MLANEAHYESLEGSSMTIAGKKYNESYQVQTRVGTTQSCTKTNDNNMDKDTVLRKGYQHTNISLYSPACNKGKIPSQAYILLRVFI